MGGSLLLKSRNTETFRVQNQTLVHWEIDSGKNHYILDRYAEGQGAR